jgi:hypothetical protein
LKREKSPYFQRKPLIDKYSLVFYNGLNDVSPLKDDKIVIKSIDVERNFCRAIACWYFLIGDIENVPEKIRNCNSFIESELYYPCQNSSCIYIVDTIVNVFEKNKEYLQQVSSSSDFYDMSNLVTSLKAGLMYHKYMQIDWSMAAKFREEYMYKMIVEIIKKYPNENFFGAFGLLHVSPQILNDERYNSYDCFSNMLKKNKVINICTIITYYSAMDYYYNESFRLLIVNEMKKSYNNKLWFSNIHSNIADFLILNSFHKKHILRMLHITSPLDTISN